MIANTCRAVAIGAALSLAGCVAKGPTLAASTLADVDYLLNLRLIRGHLLVGHALFGLGEQAAARSHARHPADELYMAVAPELERRGVAGFANELEVHAEALASGDAAAVESAYAALTAAIGRTEAAVNASPMVAGRVIGRLLREAAREYDVGVEDGQVVDAHEYQDAYGFTQVANRLAHVRHAALPIDHRARPVFAGMVRRIEALRDLWPALMPPLQLNHSATRLDAAAQEIEKMALRLEPVDRTW